MAHAASPGDSTIMTELCPLPQVFKFCCYVSIPVLMTVFIAGSPERLESIIRNVRRLALPATATSRACAVFLLTC